jgi:hypothetical protein
MAIMAAGWRLLYLHADERLRNVVMSNEMMQTESKSDFRDVVRYEILPWIRMSSY